jgi:hypothetical protein
VLFDLESAALSSGATISISVRDSQRSSPALGEGGGSGCPTEVSWQTLFDVSFSSLVTTRVIKILYILSMILIGLAALGFIFRIMESNVELVALQRERSPVPPSGPSVQPASAPPPPPIA